MQNIEKITPSAFFDYYFMIERPLGYLSYEGNYSPFEYVKFARQDLEESQQERNIINAYW